MFKVIALIKRKPGMSKADFIKHYETGHAPLARKCFPQIVQYRRNFIELEGAFIYPGTTEPDFDSVTEIWYRDRAAYDEMLGSHFSSEIQETIENDERKFLDQSMTRFFIVDQRGAKLPDAELIPSHGRPPGEGLFKVIALLTRKPGMPQADFVDYYENQHSKLIWSLFPWIVEYRRNFIDMTGAILGSAATPPDFDVVTELWFQDRSGYERMIAAHGDGAGALVAADEENCFDRSKTRLFIVEEAETR